MSPSEPAPAPNSSEEAPLRKLLIEAGPLVLFFLANWKFGIYVATGVLMAGVTVSLVFSYRLERRWPVMPLVTVVFVLIFGTLTLVLQDETFIKLKPTLVNLLFAATLLVGIMLGRPLLRPLMGSAMRLTDEGWHKLTFRFMLFFVFLAAVNEVVWRSFSTDTWVSFKVFGILPLTIVFMATQLPLLKRHELTDGSAPEPPAAGSPDR